MPGEAAPTLEAVVAGVVPVDLPLVVEEDAQPAGVLAGPVPPVVLRGKRRGAEPVSSPAPRPPPLPRVPRSPPILPELYLQHPCLELQLLCGKERGGISG